MKDILEYENKNVVITGAASGMGAATASILSDLGANVYALDIKDVTVQAQKYIQTNLMEKKSIDKGVT